MKLVVRYELKRALTGRSFLAVLIAMTLFMTLYLFERVGLRGLFEYRAVVIGFEDKYSGPSSSGLFSHIFPYVQGDTRFLLLSSLPLITLVPYASSLKSDECSGYVEQIISRNSVDAYLKAKLIANSVATALVVMIPLLLHILLFALFLPAYKPLPEEVLYFGYYGDSPGAALFYTHPLIHLIITTSSFCLLAILWSNLVMTCSRYFRSGMVLIGVMYVLQYLITALQYTAFSFVRLPITPGLYFDLRSSANTSFVGMGIVVLLYFVIIVINLNQERRCLNGSFAPVSLI